MQNRRKAILIPLLIGLLGFTTMTRKPRFELFHAVDILQLLATGMCFGVALTSLMRRQRSE
jgi:hypothetical protein